MQSREQYGAGEEMGASLVTRGGEQRQSDLCIGGKTGLPSEFQSDEAPQQNPAAIQEERITKGR